MNTAYALLLTLIFCFTGNYSFSQGYTADRQQLKTAIPQRPVPHASTNRHIKIKTTATNQFSTDADTLFMSDNNDLSDSDQSIVARAVLLWAFYFLGLRLVTVRKQPLPFCDFLHHLGTNKYLILRTLRI